MRIDEIAELVPIYRDKLRNDGLNQNPENQKILKILIQTKNIFVSLQYQKMKKGKKMAETDMNYRFLWDTEPTDAQLRAIMQEVGEDVRNQQKSTQRMVLENIKKATIEAHKEHFNPANQKIL